MLANTFSRIFLNVCLALGAALVVFLVAAERREGFSDNHCTAAGILIHYFFLAALSWMVFEAYTMYIGFVMILPKASAENRIPRIWICCLICWGSPAVIVGITASLALESYINEEYCILHGLPMVVAFFAPVAVCVVGNTIMYLLILCSLLRSGSTVTSTKKTSGIEQARRGVAISVFLGLTWISGLLAIREAKLFFQYIFCIVNSLQGFMIFLFYCVFSTEVRARCRDRFCKKTTPKENENSNALDVMEEIGRKISHQSRKRADDFVTDSRYTATTSMDNTAFSEE